MLVIVLTSGVAIALASALTIGYHIVTSRLAAVYDLRSTANIIAVSCVEELELHESRAAERTLTTLQTRPEILLARILDKEGNLFAQYSRTGLDVSSFPPDPLGEQYAFNGSQLVLSHRILSGGDPIGTVVLRSDRTEAQLRLRYSIIIVAMLMAAAVCIALLLAARLQEVVSGPIRDLASVARAVTTQKDYSLRASHESQDETGVLVGTFNEMLEQIQRRDADLRASEERYRQSAESLRLQGETARNLEEGIVLTRARDATIVYANPKFERMFGYDAGELLGRPSSTLDTGPRGGSSETTKRIIATLEAEGKWSGEVHNVKKDGSEFWCSTNVATFDHPEFGRVWISVHADIAERKRAEELLRQAEENFRLLVEQVPAITYTAELGAAGPWHYISPQVEPLLGFSPEEWVQDPVLWQSRLHPEDRALAVAAEEDCRGKGRFSAEYRLLAKDGHEVWVRDEGVVVPGAAGRPPVIQGFIQDITVRKQLEKKLLEVSDREQRRIGQDLHDGVCQLLTATTFAIKALEQKLAAAGNPESTEAREIAELLRRANGEARNVARGLHPVGLEEGGLRAALHELAYNVQSLSNIPCRFDCEPACLLKDSAKAVHVYRITQEAVNNALKHSGAKRIGITLAPVNGNLSLTVNDDGVGIPERAEERRGMGLDIMAYRAEMIGGALQVRRRQEGGTMVNLVFPNS